MWPSTPGTVWPPIRLAALLLEDTELAGEPGSQPDNEQLHLKLEGVG